MAYMVACALLSESFAVLALACYILLCLLVIMGLLPRDVSRPEPPDRAPQREQPLRRTAEPQLGPGSRRRLVQAGRAPARPGQITSAGGRKDPNLLLPKEPPAERAFCRSAPALLDAATLHALQATAFDRMVANTREAPKTPPAPSTLVRFRSYGADSAGAWEITDPAKPSIRRPASETSLGGIELSAKQTGRNKATQAKEPAWEVVAFDGCGPGVVARRNIAGGEEVLRDGKTRALRHVCTGARACAAAPPVQSSTPTRPKDMRRSSSHESLQLSREIVIHGDSLAVSVEAETEWYAVSVEVVGVEGVAVVGDGHWARIVSRMRHIEELKALNARARAEENRARAKDKGSHASVLPGHGADKSDRALSDYEDHISETMHKLQCWLLQKTNKHERQGRTAGNSAPVCTPSGRGEPACVPAQGFHASRVQSQDSYLATVRLYQGMKKQQAKPRNAKPESELQ